MKTLTLTETGVTAKITIRPAKTGDSLRREMLAAKAIETPQADDVDQTAAVVFYPRCVACSDGEIAFPDGQVVPLGQLTPTEFVALPAYIFDSWWQAVTEVNPRWGFGNAETPAQAEANEKKG